jgi:hypothetical protein
VFLVVVAEHALCHRALSILDLEIPVRGRGTVAALASNVVGVNPSGHLIPVSDMTNW